MSIEFIFKKPESSFDQDVEVGLFEYLNKEVVSHKLGWMGVSITTKGDQ